MTVLSVGQALAHSSTTRSSFSVVNRASGGSGAMNVMQRNALKPPKDDEMDLSLSYSQR